MAMRYGALWSPTEIRNTKIKNKFQIHSGPFSLLQCVLKGRLFRPTLCTEPYGARRSLMEPYGALRILTERGWLPFRLGNGIFWSLQAWILKFLRWKKSKTKFQIHSGPFPYYSLYWKDDFFGQSCVPPHMPPQGWYAACEIKSHKVHYFTRRGENGNPKLFYTYCELVHPEG